MGEMTKQQAEYLRDTYVTRYQTIKEEIEKNMGDMDFTNATQKDEMEEYISTMQGICDTYIESLEDMIFS